MAATVGRERMSSVDTAWLRMDRPSNLMKIVGNDVIERPVDTAALRAVIEERLLAFDRFRQRVEYDATGAAWWVDDDRFDLDAHLVPHRLDGEAGDVELQRFVAELAITPLDPERPLWQFHLVHGYKGTDALVARIHHCIADGIALVRVLLSLTDDAPPPSGTRRRARAAGPGGDEHGDAELTSNPWRPFLQPITAGAVKAIEATGSAIGATGSAVARSVRIAGDPEKLADVAQAAQRVIVDAARIALMTSDTQTCLKGVPGVAKGIAWNEPLPLDDVKLVCRALGASVNDVLMSCVAGALRTYLRGRGEDTTGCEIRAMVPVNLRRTDGPIRLGNAFGLVPLELPVGIANPIARLQEVRRRMDNLKGGYQAVLAYTLLEVVGRAPKLVQDPILHYVASKATAVMTNVPGPKEPLSLAGRRLSRMMFWVPQSGDIGFGVSILSYAGGVQFGVIADRKLCPEPQQLIDAFKPQFEALMLICAMLPPDMLGGVLDADGLEHALFGEPPKAVA
ncbi:MAG: wax ester/triacylglycerol synthase family O-acyltransferase [Burkholderiales bacterium]